jgi:hypothetical protein
MSDIPGHRGTDPSTARPTSIVLAAILLAFSGVVGLLSGLLVVASGGALTEVSGEAGLSEQLLSSPYAFGAVAIVWGALEIAAAYGLWRLRLWGGHIAVFMSLLAIIVSIITFTTLALVDILLSGLVLLLVARGWKSLKKATLTRPAP